MTGNGNWAPALNLAATRSKKSECVSTRTQTFPPRPGCSCHSSAPLPHLSILPRSLSLSENMLKMHLFILPLPAHRAHTHSALLACGRKKYEKLHGGGGNERERRRRRRRGCGRFSLSVTASPSAGRPSVRPSAGYLHDILTL